MEPAHDALVRGWEKIQSWLIKEKNLLLQRRLSTSATEWNKQQKAKFLWHTNPYLEVLNKEVLRSVDNNWLNQIETQFIQQSLLRKRQNSITRWSLVNTALLLLSGTAGAAGKYAIDAQNRLLESSSSLAESMFVSNRGLDALVKATETGELLKKTPSFWVNPKAEWQVISTLQNIAYGISERDHIVDEMVFESISFTPDDQMVATGSETGVIKLWSPKGELIQTLSHGTSSILQVGFTEDGEYLISVSVDQGAKVWQRQPNSRFVYVRSIEQQESTMSAAISPNLKTVALASMKTHTIQVWSIEGKLLKTLDKAKHIDSINGLSFRSDGRMLASGSADRTVKVWDLENNHLIKTIQVTKQVSKIQFVDLQTIAVGGVDGTIGIWSIGNAPTLNFQSRHLSAVESLAMSPDGKRLISASRDDEGVNLWSTEDGALLNTFNSYQDNIRAISFDRENEVIASTGDDRSIRFWQINSRVPKLEGASFSFSSKGETVATERDGIISLRRLDGKVEREFSTHTEGINRISFASDDKSIATVGADGSVQIWDLNGKLLTDWVGHQKSATSLNFSPNGKMVVSGSLDKTIKLWSLEDKSVKSLEVRSEVVSVNFSPDSQMIASANLDGTVKLWHSDGSPYKTLKRPELTGAVLDVSFSPDGRKVASGSEDGNISVWEVNSDLPPHIFSADEDEVNQVKFSPDGKILISSGSSDNTIKIWTITGKLLQTLSGHSSPATDIGFSPDGKTIASAEYDDTVILWNFDLDSLLSLSCSWLTDFLSQPIRGPDNSHVCDSNVKSVTHRKR